MFVPTTLAGSFLIHLDRNEDERGYFARLWCREELAAHGIDLHIVQSSISHNRFAGTLRGMHFQWPPSSEAKLVRCERGRIFDVVIDLRPDSPTFCRHFSVTLDGASHATLLVPPLFAHGFQTLEDESDVVYAMSDSYRPELADGVRYDDPVFAIDWPLPVTRIIDRDRNYPDFDRDSHVKKLSRSNPRQEALRQAWGEGRETAKAASK